MGRKSDKLYVTATEWKQDFGGHKGSNSLGSQFKRLPFYCCALTLQPFEIPACDPEGHVYEYEHILHWIKKYKTNPVSGSPLEAKSLIKLNFFKNNDGQYHCPLTYKIFNDHTHIVAIKTSGNVYSYDAIEKLNIAEKNWNDLMTGEKFTRKDVIVIQDPHSLGSRNINSFEYVKKELLVPAAEETGKGAVSETINAIGSTSRILSELASKDEAKKQTNTSTSTKTPSFIAEKKKEYNQAHYSKGAAAASLTSTSFTPVLKNEHAVFTEEEFMFLNVKEKAFVKLVTNLGTIDLELFCPDTPKTCYNFIQLAKLGKYNGTIFHRVIPDFMAQGGDPTGTGKGGESIWGRPFEDEFVPHLSHSSRGILSMANKGKKSNTYNKHTVFGKIVNGLDVLKKIEETPTNLNTDEPRKPIVITEVKVDYDPFVNVLESKRDADKNAALEKANKLAQRERKQQLSAMANKTSSASDSIGKYLAGSKRPSSAADNRSTEEIPEIVAKKSKATAKKGFGNFDSW